MNDVADRLRAIPLSKLFAVLAIAIAVAIPFWFDSGHAFVDDCVLALAYVAMALGLNIIVGFAGLLDLGYVAFFAIGAYTIGYLGSNFLAGANGGEGVHLLVGSPASEL